MCMLNEFKQKAAIVNVTNKEKKPLQWLLIAGQLKVAFFVMDSIFSGIKTKFK